jgi:glutathione S-transferase
MSLTLYYHPLASFCHKVLIALYENDTPFEKRFIDLGKDSDRQALRALWPPCKFPVVHDDARGRSVAETTIIIEYLQHYYPGRHRLIPADFDEALDVRLWDRVFDSHVQGPMQDIVNDALRQAHGDLTGARSALDTAYGMIDRQLAAHTWIVGNDFSMADCAAAPALFYASTLRSFPDSCSRLAAYFERLMGRPSVQRVLEEARPYFALYPFKDDIPQRFR